MSDIAERVKKIVIEHLGVDAAKVTDNASFIDDSIVSHFRDLAGSQPFADFVLIVEGKRNSNIEQVSVCAYINQPATGKKSLQFEPADL